MNVALRYVEGKLFKRLGKFGILEKGTNRNQDVAKVRRDVEAVCGKSDLLPVVIDVHSWLNNYVDDGYAAEALLPAILQALTWQTFEQDAIVFTSSGRNAAGQ